MIYMWGITASCSLMPKQPLQYQASQTMRFHEYPICLLAKSVTWVGARRVQVVALTVVSWETLSGRALDMHWNSKDNR